MIRAADLVDRFYISLNEHWGYIYGCSHEKWTEAKQREYERKYSDDADRKSSCTFGGKWVGHWVTDCSGLFHYWFRQLGGEIEHGSNSIWNDYCSQRGTLKAGAMTDGQPILPGTAVFKSNDAGEHNHVGLYVGGGLVIEAQGAKAGVCTSMITNPKWTHWGMLRDVNYDGGEKTMTAKVVLPQGKSGKTVNMREKPSTGSGIVKQIPVGSEVDLYEDLGQWCRIGYNGLTGYMMSDYLEYGQQDETGGADLTPEEMNQIDVCLTSIQQAVKAIDKWAEQIGSIIGRG